MNYSPKSPTSKHEAVREPLVGSDVLDVVQAGKDHLSDWVELMEAVEALCPVWPRGKHPMAKQFEFKLALKNAKGVTSSVPFSAISA